jgi:hypothetical protein
MEQEAFASMEAGVGTAANCSRKICSSLIGFQVSGRESRIVGAAFATSFLVFASEARPPVPNKRLKAASGAHKERVCPRTNRDSLV